MKSGIAIALNLGLMNYMFNNGAVSDFSSETCGTDQVSLFRVTGG